MNAQLIVVLLLATVMVAVSGEDLKFPIVINTWPFTVATDAAFQSIMSGNSAVDAVVDGCSACEATQCDKAVGYGGSPDDHGETTLDAMVIDGTTMDVGSVGALRRVKSAISVARAVMNYTEHTLLVGDQATAFAVQMGFSMSNLTTNYSEHLYENWRVNASCQPNYWVPGSVEPNSTASCGPYKPSPHTLSHPERIVSEQVSRQNHDTIAMAVLDGKHIAAGTSTNGLTHKIAGRVGDSPISGAGCFADSEVGACGATGDGDIMMRFVPCYQTVESMRLGMSPYNAALDAMKRIASKYPTFVGAIFAVNKTGGHAGISNNWDFEYSVRSADMNSTTLFNGTRMDK